MISTEKDGWHNKEISIGGKSFTVEKSTEFNNKTKSEKLILAEELTPLTGKGFLRNDLMSEELQQDVANHVVESQRLTIVRNNEKKPVAFIASEVANIDGQVVYHLGGIIIDPSLQGSGLAKTMLTDELLETGADILILRTQSKKMLGLASKFATLDAELTLHFAKIIYPENLDGYINKGVYRNGHSLYEDESAFAKDAIEEIDWRAGDSLVVCGWVIIPQTY